ncbi:hypothetical protein GCM10023189_59100 [Nibrella saemangeumensis]|uniref:Integrase n=1 Tax=Nibrella saemangeumensis TaxID=1084526 RepID=A0ABP8NP70_9BACT
MGLEIRNGRPYYYRKVRRDGKVTSEYAGSGIVAEYAALMDEADRPDKEQQRESSRQQREADRKADQELLSLEQSLNELFTAVALANGYHKVKRQWRKKRQR